MYKSFARSFYLSTRILSAQSEITRNTIRDIRNLFDKKVPISVVTAWDAITAKLCEKAKIDVVLVGDSLAMVALGHDDTNALELEDMVHHVKAVERGNKSSLLIADLPFGSFEESDVRAVRSAITLVKKGKAQAVKIEGGSEMAPTITKIIQAGIPVMGHIGLSPQKHNASGGFRLQGDTFESAKKIIEDSKTLERAGVFAMVVECVPNKLAQIITDSVSVPTIGIGAGNAVSGQVLVAYDALGMGPQAPAKFVKKYMNMYEEASQALQNYKKDVQNSLYPDPDTHGYKIPSEVLSELRALLSNTHDRSTT